MNCFIFRVFGAKAIKYLNGLTLVAVWEDTETAAAVTAQKYFGKGNFALVSYEDVKGEAVGNLH